MKKIKPLFLLLCILICFIPALIGSYVTYPALLGWYPGLHKPFFNPPNAIFGPVWTILYTLMGVSLYVFWEKHKKGKSSKGTSFFFVQLLLNLLWSIVFFALESPLLGFIVIIFLWISIFMTILEFKKQSTLAAKLLYPYLAWVSFAALLNLSILLLN